MILMMYLLGMCSATFMRGARLALAAARQTHRTTKVFMLNGLHTRGRRRGRVRYSYNGRYHNV